MPKIELPIANGFYESRSLPWSAQRLVNWYPSYAETSTLSPAVLYGIPGTTELVNTGATEFNRGAHVMKNVPYFVNGSTLYKLERSIDGNNNEVFTAVSKGTIPGSGFVSMADNGTQLCIVIPGVDGYIYNVETDTFEIISDPDFKSQGNSERVVFIDGYFVHIVAKVIFHSEFNDGLDYNALDFGFASADPDDIVSSFVLKNQLYILGRETIEVFTNVGKFPFTFQRIPGYFQSIGCFAPFSPVLFNSGMAFVGGSTNERIGVFLTNGNSYQRISTTPIEQKIQNVMDEDADEIFCWTYSEDGATFLGVNVGEFTFVYDAKSSQLSGRAIWHERASTRTSTLSTTRWRVNSLVTAYERILVGDVFSGRIGELSLDVYTEYDNIILRTLATQPLTNQGQDIFVHQMELTMNSGSTNDDVLDPKIEFRFSKNGLTYSDYRSASVGQQGDFGKRLFWRRLGRMSRFVFFEWRFSENTDPTIIKAEVLIDTA